MNREQKPLYDPVTGIHRAKLWEIGFYALNNLSTNMYAFAFMYVSYFLVGIVGVSVVLAGSISTMLRIWDGVTDPFIGFVVDRTNGRFGKNRPFIVLGQIFMIIGTALIFLVLPGLPQAARFPFYVVCYMFYIVGYTFQCVITKSAQACLTNDPGQRPVFSIFDSVYSQGTYTILPIIVTLLMLPKYNIYDAAGNVTTSAFYNPDFFVAFWLLCGSISLVCAVLAIVGLWRKDRPEFYGTGKAQLITPKDYWDVLKNNRPIKMLCLAACSDKLTVSMQTSSVVMIMLFGVVIGNYNTYASFTGFTVIPMVLVAMALVFFVSRHMGQRAALILGTWGGLIGAAAIFFLLVFGDPTTVNFASMNLYTIAFVVLYIIMRGFGSLSNTIVIPMTADCADYEVYRSGKYVPGLMGTLFSFIDKFTSSFAGVIVSLLLATIGFTDVQPTPETPYSSAIFWVTIFCFLGAPVIGWLLNLVAMKYYDLTKEKMAEIQEEIAAIKAAAMSGKEA